MSSSPARPRRRRGASRDDRVRSPLRTTGGRSRPKVAIVSGPPVTVYLLRHGVAAKRATWTGDDGLRTLTDEGRATLARAAGVIARLGVAPAAIVTSPLVRARQTAEIMAEALGAAGAVVDDDRLAPGFDATRLPALLGDHLERGGAGGTGAGDPGVADGGAIMLVGHEPDFSHTIGQLTGGAVVCKKGSLARVDLPDRTSRRGTLVWLLQPKVLSL